MRERIKKLLEALRGSNLTANLGLKAVALFAAFVVWILVASQEKRVIELPVPLNIQNVPSGLTVAEPVPETVRVYLRGTRTTLDRISTADVSVSVDLARAQAGEQIELLDEQNVQVPFGVETERIVPPQLILTLEPVVTRKVPILPNLTGDVPPGFVVAETVVEPSEARVRGSRTHVESSSSVSTQPVPLNGRRNSFSINVRVLSPHTEVKVLEPETASVRVKIDEVEDQRTLAVPVETVGEARGRVQINPRTLSVTLAGAASQVASLQASDLRVTVPIDGLEPRDEDYHLPAEVSLRREGAFTSVNIIELSQPRIDVHVYPVTGE